MRVHIKSLNNIVQVYAYSLGVGRVKVRVTAKLNIRKKECESFYIKSLG